MCGVTNESECNEIEKKYRATLEDGDSVAHNLATQPNESMWFDWTPYMNQKVQMKKLSLLLINRGSKSLLK